MLYIAICDDQPLELERLAAYTKEYIEANRIDAEIRAFTHPDALLIACETERFSLYLLDIVMPMVNGIELGREIRSLDREAQIIYATTEPSFALEAYAANPVNYLLKPVNKTLFFETLTLAVSKLKRTEDGTITVKTNGGLRVVPLFSVVCCEYVQRAVQYTLMSGEMVTTRTLQESFTEHVAPLLRDDRFLQPHNAFVMNMSRVESFSKDGFIMRGGTMVPISTKQYSVMRDTYMDYLLSKEKLK